MAASSPFLPYGSILNNFAPPTNFTVNKISMAEFPALNGQSVSYALSQNPADSVNPPQSSHPPSCGRASLPRLRDWFTISSTAMRKTTPLLCRRSVAPAQGLYRYRYVCSQRAFTKTYEQAFKTDAATTGKIEAGLKPPKA
ncbi:hypothetical protein SLEP1_g5392 [Rubroshorea leprosula]|uniref:Uncharacterized protein n=1 Tax=Rubroshorea leprosula TaxID=152421 RepID=A0AAV5I0M6_9ROSI|nr:hypothetical protein SLEP1_g5392 [Rubroshorea leprosula]